MTLTKGNTPQHAILLCCFTVCALLFACSPRSYENDDEDVEALLIRYRDIKFADGDRAALNFADSVLKNGTHSDMMLFDLYKIKFGIYLFSFQQYDSSMTYADSMLTILERNPHMSDYNSKLAQTRSAKGDAYYYSGKFRDAFNWYDLNTYSDIEDATPCFNAAHNFRIAMTMYRTERFIQAAKYFKRSFLLYDSCDNDNMELQYRRQQVLDNIGLCYSKAHIYDSAMLYYRQTLDYIHTYEKQYGHKQKMWNYAAAVVYDNMGSVYAATAKPDSALHAFHTSLSLSEEYPRDHFHIHTKMARLYTETGQQGKAKAELDIIQNILAEDSMQEPAHIYDLEEALWLYHRNTGNLQLATKHLYTYQQLKDSLFVRQKDALIEELYAAGEKEAQHRTDILKKNKEIRTQSQLTLLFICISALLAGGWLVRLLMKQNRKFSNYRRARAEQERRLKSQIQQKERHLLSIMNNTDDLVWAVDNYFKLTTFNKAYDALIFNITGRYAEIGKPSNIAAANPGMYERWIGWHKRAMAGEAFTVTERMAGLKAGTSIDIEARFWPLHNSENQVIGVGCLVRDISEYLENTRRIEAQNNMLKEIAYMQSHDVRGPVATMKGLLHLITTGNLPAGENQNLLALLEKQLDELDETIHTINNKTKQL